MQIVEIKRIKILTLKQQNEIDDQGVSDTYNVPQTDATHDKGDIKLKFYKNITKKFTI